MGSKYYFTLEWLMNYGWAILASIVVISVLLIWFRPSTLITGEIADSCLEKIAKNECENRGLIYLKMQQSTIGDKYKEFVCLPNDNRSMLNVPFKFYEEEVKYCKNVTN